MRLRFTAICLLLMILLPHSANGQTQKLPCTQQEAIQAETEASSLANWDELHTSFKRFTQCDDGAIAEGYSDSVARLLSKNWNTVSHLNLLTTHDKLFGEFVLRHVDESMSPSEAQEIFKNTKFHCPSQSKKLCDEIATQIKQLPSSGSERSQ
jgi:hypothetical protein